MSQSRFSGNGPEVYSSARHALVDSVTGERVSLTQSAVRSVSAGHADIHQSAVQRLAAENVTIEQSAALRVQGSDVSLRRCAALLLCLWPGRYSSAGPSGYGSGCSARRGGHRVTPPGGPGHCCRKKEEHP